MNPTTPGEQVGCGCGVQLESTAWLSGRSQGREGKGQRENVHSSELRGWAQSSVPKGSQAGFLGPPECQGARVLARSLARVAGNHSAMRIKTSRGPCAALGQISLPLVGEKQIPNCIQTQYSLQQGRNETL